ncbi:MAG: glycoside hydrolase family 5 protein [Oscillospiraceae bacterium]|nr:glycoside hydrolase family 5 protein [Oscillospiraceae bacterium]
MKTHLSIKGDSFLINGAPTYSEVPGANPASLGLLWNQRVVQGVFDDRKDRSRFNQFKMKVFDPQKNTENLIASLPAWHAYGLRAITVCFQGGWPVGALNVEDIDNNPFSKDGLTLDAAYAKRMDSIIRAADELGMVVIVTFLYWAQTREFTDGRAVANAVRTGARFLKEGGYTNVIVEVANEYNINPFRRHPLVFTAQGMAQLIKIAREESGGMPVGCSGGGGMADREVVEESDVAIVHGNGLTRGQYYDFINKVKGWAGGKPVLCNEDSPCCTRVDVGLETHTSWGYYNNYTKQIPPADFGVTCGEDVFFARRVARAVGIPVDELPHDERFYLQGLEDHTVFSGMRVVRLACEFPEKVSYVDFYEGGKRIYRSYDEPFFVNRETTWTGTPRAAGRGAQQWEAIVTLTDGNTVKKSTTAKGVDA